MSWEINRIRILPRYETNEKSRNDRLENGEYRFPPWFIEERHTYFGRK